MPVRLLLVACAFISLASVAPARLVNFTIDDEDGDERTGVKPRFTPDGKWTQGSTCPGCKAQPDASRIFKRTWHDATYHTFDGPDRTISFDFEGKAFPSQMYMYDYGVLIQNVLGQAIYVFFLLANNIPYVTTFTNLSFTLDGEHMDVFSHEPTDSPDYDYNVPVFAKTDVPTGRHSMNVVATGANHSLLLFDYVIYRYDLLDFPQFPPYSHTSTSVDVPDDSTTPPSPTGPPVIMTTTSIRTDTEVSTSTVATIINGTSTTFTTAVSSNTQLRATTTTSLALRSDTNSPVQPKGERGNLALVVGSALGGFLFVFLIAGILFCFWKKRRRSTVTNTRNTKLTISEWRQPVPMDEDLELSPNQTHAPASSRNSIMTQFTRTVVESEPRHLRSGSSTLVGTRGSQQQEIEKRIDDIQKTITTLSQLGSPPRRQARSDAAATADNDGHDGRTPSGPGQGTGPDRRARAMDYSSHIADGGDVESLRRRIAQLQLELERLSHMDEAPPDYYEVQRS